MTAPEHPAEPVGNALRQRALAVEPASLRTYTPSLAVIARSAGAYHWTVDGRKLADFASGVLVANLGHHPARWWRRVWGYLGVGGGDDAGDRTAGAPKAQGLQSLGLMENGGARGAASGFLTGVPLTSYNAVTELEVLASERLLANLRSQPGGARMETVAWAASGSEAIQKALWAALARRQGSDVILATRAGFHGKKGLAGAITGSERDPERDRRVRFVSFPTDECQSVFSRRQPLDLAPYAAELDALWSEFGPRICCLCTEPYLGGGGSYHPQPAYLQLLDRFCKQHDVLFILDEIQSNFGRTGPMYAFTHYGVEPDIVCLGKGLGNGVPVAAAVGRADVFAALTYGQTSDTYSANPLACAAVLATLDEFESTDVLEQGRKLSQVLEAGLLRLVELNGVEFVRGEGTVWGIECAAVGNRTAGDMANAFVLACYRGDEHGRAIHLLGPLAGKVLRVSPPLVIPLDEAREYLDAMYDIFARECQQV